MSTVRQGLSRFSAQDLITYVRNIVTLMTGNPDYLTPSPALADVTTAVNALEAAT